ncbi:MAG: fatty acid desaturase [Alphaproteobacteria bacterium]|nr:fatty acid desaturase [Alphaproteobacteria bacterium]
MKILGNNIFTGSRKHTAMPELAESAARGEQHYAAVIGELPTWILIVAIYGGWFTVTWFFGSLPWWAVLPAGAWFVAWHNSFQHEALHGHPSRHVWLNELLAWPPLCLWIPYPVYRDCHRAHHATRALTDPFDDPESFYLTRSQWAQTGPVHRALLVFNNTLVGRMTIGPWLAAAAFWKSQFLAMAEGDRRYAGVWGLHIALCGLMFAWLWQVCGISPLDYVLMFAWPGLSLSLIRSFYEHRPAPGQDGRTVIVDAALPMSLLFLNNNLHVVHHNRPDLPWFALPAVYRRDRAEILRRAHGFHFPGGYLEIARRFAFRPKDLPVQPG